MIGINLNFDMRKDSDSIEWYYFENSQEGAVYLGREISKLLFLLKDVQVLLFVSGGSSLTVLPYTENEDYSHVTISVLDERFGKTNENNNFSQLKLLPWSDYFLKKGGKFISTKILKGDTQKKLAERFEKEIENWMNINKKGKMIALFGMGSDGHTAGIFPFPEDSEMFNKIFDSKNIIASYDAAEKNIFPNRITTTNAIFKKIEIGFAFICGEEKRKALNDFKENNKKSNELPIMFLKSIKKIKIVTDIK